MWKRLANLWRGFLSLWISDIEKEHPEIAYENAINSMVAKYSKLKTATAGIIRRREDLDERYKRATTELAQTEAELDTAVTTNQDDLAVIRRVENRDGTGTYGCRLRKGLFVGSAIRDQKTSERTRFNAGEDAVGAGADQGAGTTRRFIS
jgi:hypothetical protein